MSELDPEAYTRALEDALLLFIRSADSPRFVDPAHGSVLKEAWIRATRRKYGVTPQVIECPLDRWLSERRDEFSTRLRNSFWFVVPQEYEHSKKMQAGILECLGWPAMPTVFDLVCTARRLLLKTVPNLGEVSLKELENFLAEEGLAFGMSHVMARVAYRPREGR